MKNKYQDALDCVLSTEKRPYVDWHSSVEELQELVDKEISLRPTNNMKLIGEWVMLENVLTVKIL